MSYISEELRGTPANSEINSFLEDEGFEYGTGAKGEGTMFYVAQGSNTVWFALCTDHLSLYAEYDCGGCISETSYHFEENDYDSFKEAYKNAVSWAKRYM